MTLRGVIQGLLRGSDDAEAMLADDGYGDLPPEMFGQALSSYADTAPMAEADALSPVLTTIDAGDAADVFAVLQEQPLVVQPESGADVAGLAASIAGVDTVDDLVDDLDDGALDDFGTSVAEDVDLDDVTDLVDDAVVETAGEFAAPETTDDPFESEMVDDAVADTAGEFEELEDFFDTEPEATGDDPSDLDF